MNTHSLIKSTSVLLTLLLVTSATLLSQDAKFDVTSSYRARDVHGWTVYIQKRLLREKRDSGARAYSIVTDQLSRLTRTIPTQQLKQLQQVPIWICDRSEGPIHYHPQREWLIKNGYNPDKAKAVDISQVNNIIRSENTQPSVMLHELAHAYHDQVLGFDNPDVLAAYKQAIKSGTYESVLGIRGQQIRHYALTNEKEYFAECTEAFFGTNDFYPFVRAELKQFDPQMYQTLVKVWGVDPNKR
jgi:ribosomal protein L39E